MIDFDIDLSVKAKRRPSKAKFLGKKYGGKWKYDNYASWWCDDGVRHVSRVSSCGCDDYCHHRPDYRMYGGGNNGVIIYFV